MPQDVNPLLDRLCEAFPACFSRSAPKPLKIGLGEELLALAGVHPALTDLSRTQLRRAIKVYTGSPAYRKALARGGPRYGLDGQPTGEVTPEQQAFAKTPRPKPPAAPASPPAPEPQGPESPAAPATGYLPMTLKRRIETQRAGWPDQGAAGPPTPESHSQPQPTE
jgi:sRNA-binding protein